MVAIQLIGPPNLLICKPVIFKVKHLAVVPGQFHKQWFAAVSQQYAVRKAGNVKISRHFQSCAEELFLFIRGGVY
jgi:hypothetical protein